VANLPGVFLLEPDLHQDDRGWLFEAYNAVTWADMGGPPVDFVQDNHSHSRMGVVRGIHYQLGSPQGKLVRVVIGSVWDVAVDLRSSSPTFGRWYGCVLSADNRRAIWVPPGFGHGFMVTSDVADVIYKTTTVRSPQHERGIRFDDPDLGVEWPALSLPPVLSSRDASLGSFREAEVFP